VKEMFEREADMLHTLAKKPHSHLIKYQGAIERGDKWHFIFPWADQGTLQSFWVKKKCPDYSSSKFFLWFIEQLYGLSQALEYLHSKNLRHGDLKPDNILVFSEPKPESLGKLVIADVGLARKHSRATEARPRQPTITMSGTQKYEPPETLARETDARSRVYDTWSMGCICLETIIWLLWGFDGLHHFSANMGDSRFWEGREVGHELFKPCIALQVHRTIEWLQKKDVRCEKNTALGDLLDFVTRRLLVISIKNEDNSEDPVRAESQEFREEMERIARRAQYQAHYLSKSARAPEPNLTYPVYPVYQSKNGHLTVPSRSSPKGPLRPLALDDADTTNTDGILATLESDLIENGLAIPMVHAQTESLPALQPQSKQGFLTSTPRLNSLESVPAIVLENSVGIIHYLTLPSC
jgi:serine/threonine protein kinase